MIVQNNPKPWVVLAVIVLVVCVALGIVIGADPLGPGQTVRAEQAQTQLAVNISATEGALSAIQTPQAIYAHQTAIAADLAGMPLYQTATTVAMNGAAVVAQANATQTALVAFGQAEQVASQATQTSIAQQQYLNGLAFNATSTALVQQPKMEAVQNNVTLGLVVIGTLAVSILIISRSVIQVLRSRAQEKVAVANLLEEKKEQSYRKVTVLSSRQQSILNRATLPSLAKQSGDYHNLPRAE